MAISEQITRLQNLRNRQRTKIAELGLGDGTESFEACTDAVESIVNKGTISAEVKEGGSYSLEPGYYKGGTIAGVSGGGNYELQAKEVTPTKSEQVITQDSGKYGLSSVTVKPIPSQYQDVSDVTATAETVLANNIFVDAQGTVTAGTMADNGTLNLSIDGLNTTEVIIPKGFHKGDGKVSLTNDIELALAAL